MKETNLTQEQELALFEKFKEMLKNEDRKKRIYHRRSHGTGSIAKLSGNRKKPFAAVVTVGRDEDSGRQIKKCLGTYKSREDAETALSAYNLHKKGIEVVSPELNLTDEQESPTFADIWNKIYEEDILKLSQSSINNYKTAFGHLIKLHPYKISTITLKELQPLFTRLYDDGAGYSKLNTMKVICKKIFTYAMKYDYCTKDYSEYITFGKQNEKRFEHIPFSHEEILRLWNASRDSDIAKFVLIYIYTGMRPIEFTSMKMDDIHLEEKYMVGGVKTVNGINRIIPIHKDILPFIEDFKKGIISFEGKDSKDKYNRFRKPFKNLMKDLNMEHSQYDTRHTFATLCNEFQLNDYLIKKIIGHSCKDLTKDVYTHANIERLVSEVNKLPDKCHLQKIK